MDLFNQETGRNLLKVRRGIPLAALLRPKNLDEVVGNPEIVGPESPLRRWIERDQLPSLIFWGPPGVGKTTLAQIIAQQTQSHFEQLSAVQSGIKDIKEVVERARSFERSLLFVDEIHRFNKTQQDALLPHVEEGVLTLIGATTENPSFEVNTALLSRVRVLRLNALSNTDLQQLLEKAQRYIMEKDKLQNTPLSPEALLHLAHSGDGDARQALTLYENIYRSLTPDLEIPLSLEKLKSLLAQSSTTTLRYDKGSEQHYDCISAFIKSMRASQTTDALYYLARMLDSGEDPKFIVRRMLIFASEDIGNADPQALILATAVKDAVVFVGLPEACINLAQGVRYLCQAPKNRDCMDSILTAFEQVKSQGSQEVPPHLKNR